MVGVEYSEGPNPNPHPNQAYMVGVEDPEGELQLVVALLRLYQSDRPLPPNARAHPQGLGVCRGECRGGC